MASVRLAELLGALSMATDLAAGLPPETALRVAVIGVRTTRALGSSGPPPTDVFWASLLRFLGCTGYATETAAIARGDDLGLLRDLALVDASRPIALMRRIARGAADRGGAGLALSTVAGVASRPSMPRDFATAHCAQATALARDLGLSAGVVEALGQILERWDGRGQPSHLAGDEISPVARVLHAAFRAEVHRSLEGPRAAVGSLKMRSGGELEPAVVSALLDAVDLGALGGPEIWDELLAVEPAPWSTGEVAALAPIFARYVDLKSPWTLRHSIAVGELAGRAAAVSGLSEPDQTRLAVAGWLHDLGRCGVPNGVWDKPGALGIGETAKMREHSWLTDRILARTPILAGIAPLASRHHERLDGSGYHRGVGQGDLDFPARLLAAADVAAALSEDRPHRPAMSRESTLQVLSGDASSGRLDRRAVDAVLEAAGAPRLPRTWPDGLSDREVEVLGLLARGLSNKEIAARLFVSPATVKNHVLHLYEKTSVSTRAAAALYAVRHDLVPPPK